MGAVIALLRELPDHSSFKAHWFATLKQHYGDEEPEDDRSDEQKQFDFEVSDRQSWAFENKLLAMIVNAVNANTAMRGNFKKQPEFANVGPYDFWTEKQKAEFRSKHESRPSDVAAFLMGLGVSLESLKTDKKE